MIQISVRYLAPLSNIVGCLEETVALEEGSTIENLISCLSSKYGSQVKNYFYSQGGKLEPTFIISVNGVYAANFKELLQDKAEIIFIPPLAGG